MKVGIFIPTAVRHEMWEESVAANRAMSLPETPVNVLFNGTDPVPVPNGVGSFHVPGRFTDECDLWQWCLDYAIAKKWDWCMMVHDDFAMLEPGWEEQLAKAKHWRVALASWLTYDVWDEQANSANSSPGPIGVTLDSMTFGFRVDFFKRRGCVAKTRFGFGFGAWDACAYALSRNMAMWRILGNSKHQWLEKNARATLQVGAPGHQETRARYENKVLPARVIDPEHIQVVDRVIKVSPRNYQAPEKLGRTITVQNLNDKFIVEA